MDKEMPRKPIRKRIRAFLLILIVAMTTVLAIIWWNLGTKRSVIDSDAYEKISVGMAETTVEHVVGPGSVSDYAHKTWPNTPGIAKEYRGDGFTIIVWFDKHGKVLSKSALLDVDLHAERPLLQRVLAWIGF